MQTDEGVACVVFCYATVYFMLWIDKTVRDQGLVIIKYFTILSVPTPMSGIIVPGRNPGTVPIQVICKC